MGGVGRCSCSPETSAGENARGQETRNDVGFRAGRFGNAATDAGSGAGKPSEILKAVPHSRLFLANRVADKTANRRWILDRFTYCGRKNAPPELPCTPERNHADVAIVLSGTNTVREHVQRLGRILRPQEGKQAVLYELVAADTAEERTQVKDGVLRALTKLNDKDTVQTGVDEMREIIQVGFQFVLCRASVAMLHADAARCT